LQDITFTEQIHQAEEEAKLAELDEQRKHNIQYAGIAIAIITFVVIFLLLSRTTAASPRVIEFLGVVGLLILFEFINLLLHPFIGEYTHHSPLLMLGIMVVIAALLVPMHHKLEHWIKHKFVGRTSGH
jgi:NADH:ubiquinone oxidoreductase subunit 3 (subunit A)